MHWDFCRSVGVVTLPKAERGVGVASLLTTAHKPSPAAGVRSVHSEPLPGAVPPLARGEKPWSPWFTRGTALLDQLTGLGRARDHRDADQNPRCAWDLRSEDGWSKAGREGVGWQRMDMYMYVSD